MNAAPTFRPRLSSPSLSLLCVLAHHAFDQLGEAADPGAVLDALKWACAGAHLAYDGDALRKAVESVHVARLKGYRTPVRRGESARVAANIYVPPPAFYRDELRSAEGWLRAIGGCPHDPPCASRDDCVTVAARFIRERRRMP